MPSKIELCNASDVEVGAVLKVERDDLALAVFNVDGDVVECNFHGGQFNIKTGAVVGPPCMVPIRTYPTVVEDGKVFIEL